MNTYCVKCKKDTENIDQKTFRTKNNRKNNNRFVKEQKAKGILSNLGIRTPLSKIPLLNFLF